MKKVLTLLAVCFTLTGYSQLVTNSAGVFGGPITNVINFFKQFPNTNWGVAPYGVYDLTSHKAGGGLAVAYKLTDFTVPFIRGEWLDGAIWTAQGGMQLQAPIVLGNAITVTPFTFVSIATPFSGAGNNNGEPVGIMAGGVDIMVTKWSKMFSVVGDYERWTGGGFHDDMVRVGLGVSF